MKEPLVTVLMSVYNAEEFLAEAVESILAQTYPHFEFLIIDDASTDGGADLLATYQDSRIRIIRNESNLGLTRSLNRGLAQAQGKYIARMDADDVSYPLRLERQVAFMESHPEVGLCGTWALDQEEATLKKRVFPCDDRDLRFHLLKYNPFVHSSVMLKTAVIQESHLEFNAEFTYAQDYELWARMANRTKLANLPEFLVRYRIHDKQITTERFQQQEGYVKRVIQSQLQRLGINATPQAVNTHRNVLNEAGIGFDGPSLTVAHQWLVNLLLQNRTHRVYEFTHFLLKLEECWQRVLYAVPILNNDTLRLIKSSPFRIVKLSRLKFSLLLISKLVYYKVFK